MKLTICSIPELTKYEFSGQTHILSILDHEYTEILHKSGQFLPDIVYNGNHLFESYETGFERLELQFDDIVIERPGYRPPNLDDVQKILEFGKKLTEDSRLLVHCHAGISRSTAAATVILAQMFPDIEIEKIFEKVIEVRPQAYPNQLILRHGGVLLGREDELEKFGKYFRRL